jgi:hypothetical protein
MKKCGPSEPPLSDIKDYDALNSIWSALEARPSVLASRLRDGSASAQENRLAADLIEGIIKPRRPRKGTPRHQRLEIAEYVAFLEKVLPHVQGKADIARKKVVSFAHEEYGVSERYVYKAMAKFDSNALAQSERMFENSLGGGEQPTLDAERSKRVRDMLKDVDRDWLVKIIEGFLARK